MPETQVLNTDPNVQAYLNALQQNYKGRFTITAKSLALFKDNPYVMDLPEADRLEVNKKLLTPYDGEMYVDNDNFKYHCKLETSPIDGTVKYTYYSREKELYEKLKGYETSGVLNHLMSAYNNGRIYRLYADINNGLVFPSNEVVYPLDYHSYTIRSQELTTGGKPIWICGALSTEGDLVVDMAMEEVKVPERGLHYKVMKPGKLIDIGSGSASNVTADQIKPVEHGKFYIVEFKNKEGIIIDTKLYQAVKSVVSNTEVPTASVSSLSVSIIRNNIQETGGPDDVYPILTGENINDTFNFIITANYNDGTKKIITNKIGTPQLVIEGLNVDTSNVYIGQRFRVTFKYFPVIDSTGVPALNTNPIVKQIVLQVVTNMADKLYKVLPVVWSSNNSSGFNIQDNNIVRDFYLKVYTMNKDGIMENRTKQVYDTLKYVDNGVLKKFDHFPYMYDNYKQAIVFVGILDNEMMNKFVTFSFKLYSESVSTELRFDIKFAIALNETTQSLFKHLNNTEEYGYHPETGLLRELEEMNKNIVIKTSIDSYKSLTLKNDTELTLRNKYKRVEEGNILTPTHVVLYSVNDSSVLPITDEQLIDINSKSLTIQVINNKKAITIFDNLYSSNYVLAKFITINEITGVRKIINFDLFRVN